MLLEGEILDVLSITVVIRIALQKNGKVDTYLQE